MPSRCGPNPEGRSCVVTEHQAQLNRLNRLSKKPKATTPRVETLATPRTLRSRSKKVAPKSYNERYLADATAGREPTAPARPATKKAKVAKSAPKNSVALSLTKKQQEALAAQQPAATIGWSPLTRLIENYEERMEKEHEENKFLAAQQFAAGQPMNYNFSGSRCGGARSARNVRIGKLYQEMVAKAEADR